MNAPVKRPRLFPRALLERVADIACRSGLDTQDNRNLHFNLAASMTLDLEVASPAASIAVSLVESIALSAAKSVGDAYTYCDPPVGHPARGNAEAWRRDVPRELANARDELMVAVDLIDAILRVLPEREAGAR